MQQTFFDPPKKAQPFKLPPPPKKVRAIEPKKRGLLGEVYEVIEAIESDPDAMQSIAEFKFALVTIRRSGAQIVSQFRKVLAQGWIDVEAEWLQNTMKAARELLSR